MRSYNLKIDDEYTAEVYMVTETKLSIFTLYHIKRKHPPHLSSNWLLRRERTASVVISISYSEYRKFINDSERCFSKFAKTRQKYTNVRKCAKTMINQKD